MCGDFNKNLKDYSKLAEKFGLNTVLSEGTTTHKGGNHLDQIFNKLGAQILQVNRLARHN